MRTDGKLMIERMAPPDLARALADQAESIARDLFPAGWRQGNDWCVGSVAGEPGQSLRISLGGKHRGRWREFSDGSGGDLLDLAAAVLFGGDLRHAIGWARDHVGCASPPVTRIKQVEPAAPRSWTSKIAHRLWQESQPAAGTLTDLYLEARRIHCAIPPSIRHHPALEYRHGGKVLGTFPAMVAAVTDPRTGEFRGLHRTYLQPGIDPNPVGKLALTDDAGNRLEPKLSLGALAGNGIVLGGLSRRHVVFVGEGIETTARAVSLAGRGGIAAVSAGNMPRLRLPDAARLIYILVDPDPAGRNSSERAAELWTREGRKVFLVDPGEVGA
ncbi:MAG: toprim domain-containing protein [Rhodospirillales bacterium]|nr:toprim domain-containing protein [Rhodospirillales bacterium]